MAVSLSKSFMNRDHCHRIASAMAHDPVIVDPPLESVPGAYALVVALVRTVRLAIPSLGEPSLMPGRYVYCGSAWGSGGIAARVRRHLRPSRKLHWHIDYLLAAGQIVEVCGVAGARECSLVSDIMRGLRGGQHAGQPIAGFGSSDCRVCRAHLLSVESHFSLQAHPNHESPFNNAQVH
jgi:Uri superfamily endonuclease